MKRMMTLFGMMLASCAVMADTEIVDGIEWTYEISDGEARVGNYSVDMATGQAISASTAGDIIVPKYLGGCRVTDIADGAFYGCSSITTVTIPASIRNVSSYAFLGCSTLVSISIEAGNTYGYYSVDGVLFEKQYYTDSSGKNHLDVHLIAYPGGRKGAYTIPSDVTYVWDGGFQGCAGLTAVTIPKSCYISYESNPFCLCRALTSIEVESGNEQYYSTDGVLFERYSYERDDGTTNSVVRLLSYPCARAGSSYEIPMGTTVIEVNAFALCNNLTSVKIPASMTSLYDNPFAGCANLENIEVDDANELIWVANGFLFSKWNPSWKYAESEDKTTHVGLLACPRAYKGAYKVPSGVTDIGSGAFSYCHGLTSVAVPSNVKYIDSCAFVGCSGLTAINVEAGNAGGYYSVDGVLFEKEDSNDVSYPGVWLISYPEGKTGGYVIPSGVAVIYDYAFGLFSGLTSVKIPSSVKSIYEYAFYGCTNLKTIYVDKGDTARVKGLLEDSYFDVSQVTFVEGNPTLGDDPTTEGGFTGEKAMTFNGLVYDADGVMCGMAQITTAKATKKGVKVGGFVMLADGKKQTVKSVTVPIENGQLNISTKAGKTDLTLTITGDGFEGTLGDMTLASADVGEDTGILSGTLKMSYFDAKTGKVKTKSITIGGVASGGEAVGTATVKGQGAKSFAAEIE